MYKISVTPINNALYEHLNGKTISVYMFLIFLSKEENGEAVVRNTNSNIICKLMNAKHMNISYRQVVNSLDELYKKHLITYNQQYTITGELENDTNNIIIYDACIDFETKNSEDDNDKRKYALRKSKGFLYLSEIFYTNLFHRLPVTSKRLFLFVWKHLFKSKEFTINILKKENYEKLAYILRVNRPQKIRDAIEDVKKLLNISCLQNTMKVEVYRFSLNKLFSTLSMDKVSKDEKHTPSPINIDNLKTLKTLGWKIYRRILEYGISLSKTELNEIITEVYNWKWKDIYSALKSFIKAKVKGKSIDNIAAYFRSIQQSQFKTA